MVFCCAGVVDRPALVPEMELFICSLRDWGDGILVAELVVVVEGDGLSTWATVA